MLYVPRERHTTVRPWPNSTCPPATRTHVRGPSTQKAPEGGSICPLPLCSPAGSIRPLGSARKWCLSDVTRLIAAGRPGCIRVKLGICELGAVVMLGGMSPFVGGIAGWMSCDRAVHDAIRATAPIAAAARSVTSRLTRSSCAPDGCLCKIASRTRTWRGKDRQARVAADVHRLRAWTTSVFSVAAFSGFFDPIASVGGCDHEAASHLGVSVGGESSKPAERVEPARHRHRGRPRCIRRLHRAVGGDRTHLPDPDTSPTGRSLVRSHRALRRDLTRRRLRFGVRRCGTSPEDVRGAAGRASPWGSGSPLQAWSCGRGRS